MLQEQVLFKPVINNTDLQDTVISSQGLPDMSI